MSTPLCERRIHEKEMRRERTEARQRSRSSARPSDVPPASTQLDRQKADSTSQIVICIKTDMRRRELYTFRTKLANRRSKDRRVELDLLEREKGRREEDQLWNENSQEVRLNSRSLVSPGRLEAVLLVGLPVCFW